MFREEKTYPSWLEKPLVVLPDVKHLLLSFMFTRNLGTSCAVDSLKLAALDVD